MIIPTLMHPKPGAVDCINVYSKTPHKKVKSGTVLAIHIMSQLTHLVQQENDLLVWVCAANVSLNIRCTAGQGVAGIQHLQRYKIRYPLNTVF